MALPCSAKAGIGRYDAASGMTFSASNAPGLLSAGRSGSQGPTGIIVISSSGAWLQLPVHSSEPEVPSTQVPATPTIAFHSSSSGSDALQPLAAADVGSQAAAAGSPTVQAAPA